MYSDMSSWISASSSPKRNSASALLSSVFPTPEGPRKMNEPAGLGDLLVDLAHVGGRRHPADPHAAAGLVDEVDRLVGQVPVADVAVGQVGVGHQGVVGEVHAVVRLVPVAEPLQDLDRVRDG